MEEMRQHPTKGYEIMQQEELRWLLRDELPALLEHHERLDGRGYPNGLKGEQIHEIGRIVAVADVFDALTSDRPYRAGMSVERSWRIEIMAIANSFQPSRRASSGRTKVEGEPDTPAPGEVRCGRSSAARSR